MTNNITDKSYIEFLNDLKQRVISSRYKAAIAVNKELVLLYHHIGTKILESQKVHGWGAKVVEQLSHDLKNAFPEMKGFSRTNLLYMRKFAEEYPDLEFVQTVSGQLSWSHNVMLLDKITEKEIRNFYLEQAIEQGWSYSMLEIQIEQQLHKRQGQAITNFKAKLPSPQSDLAQKMLKDPYIFDFLSLGDEAQEREIEKSLVQHMEKFILNLGEGFAFVGRQYHLEVAGEDFYLDLLFYHLKLRCFCVIELKDRKFKPEDAGKMNFYLSVVDNLLKHPTDNPSIGLVLCRSKNNILVEYALRDMSKPIGLSEYQLTKAIPENIKSSLPTIEELEAELQKIEIEEEEK